jgi:hypothetical protein
MHPHVPDKGMNIDRKVINAEIVVDDSAEGDSADADDSCFSEQLGQCAKT